MGNQVVAESGFLDVPSYLHDLAHFNFQSHLGGGKAVKSLKCFHGHDFAVVKLHIRRGGGSGGGGGGGGGGGAAGASVGASQSELAPYWRQLEELCAKFSLKHTAQPGVIVWQPLEESDSAAFMARQYFAYTLKDRLHSHPFLTDVDKRWMTFQLLNAVQQCHGVGVRHGDIKTENAMVTTWNWLFLTDIAFYKPTFLPVDNPADYTYFFETDKRHRCYLAPERFNSRLGSVARDLTEAMDVFSLGCCVAEIFLEGEALFDFPGLLKYRERKQLPADVRAKLDKITVPEARELVKHMIQVEPSSRLAVSAYLEQYTGSLFPPYFAYLYRFFAKLLHPALGTPDLKLAGIRRKVPDLLRKVVGSNAAAVPLFSSRRVRAQSSASNDDDDDDDDDEAKQDDDGDDDPPVATASSSGQSGVRVPVPDELGSFVKDFDSRSRKVESTKARDAGLPAEGLLASVKDLLAGAAPATSAAPSAPGPSGPQIHSVFSPKQTQVEYIPSEHGNGLSLVLAVVCSAVENVSAPDAKITGLELMLELGRFVDDEVLLGRLVPYAVSLLKDSSSVVRALSLHTLTRLVSLVRDVPVSDAHVFSEYLFPVLSRFSFDNEELPCLVYAQNLAELATIAKRFLDTSHNKRKAKAGGGGDSSSPAASSGTLQQSGGASGAAAAQSGYSAASYDTELANLQETVKKTAIELFSDGTARVKRMLLADMTRLCVFVGRERTNEHLLPHLISVFNVANEADWELRAAVFDHIVGVSVLAGRSAFQNFILPCIVQSLTAVDAQDFVTHRAMHMLAALCRLGLLERDRVLEFTQTIAPVLCHPGSWMRAQAIDLFVAMAEHLGTVDTFCFLIPQLGPYLARPVRTVTLESLEANLKPPISRAEFECYLHHFAALERAGMNDRQKIMDTPVPPVQRQMYEEYFTPHHKEAASAAKSARKVVTSSRTNTSPLGVPRFVLDSDEALAAAFKTYLSRCARSLVKRLGRLRLARNRRAPPDRAPTSSAPLAAGAPPLPPRRGPRPPESPAPEHNVRPHLVYEALAADQTISSAEELNPYATLSQTVPLRALVQKPLTRDGALKTSGSSAASQAGQEIFESFGISLNVPKKVDSGASSAAPSASGVPSSSPSSSTRDGFGAGAAALATAGDDDMSVSASERARRQAARGRMFRGKSLIVAAPSAADPRRVDTASHATRFASRLAQQAILGDMVTQGSVTNSSGGGPSSGVSGIERAPLVSDLDLARNPALAAQLAPDSAQALVLPRDAEEVDLSMQRALGAVGAVPDLGEIPGNCQTLSSSSLFKNHPRVVYPNRIRGAEPDDWRPRGVLVSTLREHTDAVQRLAVSRDNLFFASGSRDGTVKIWDCRDCRSMLSPNSFHSRLTYNRLGAPVTDMVVCDSSHSVAVAGENGAVHVVRVETASAASATPSSQSLTSQSSVSSLKELLSSAPKRVDYTGTTAVKMVDMSVEGPVLAVDHFNSVTESLLAYGTERGHVHGWDLRAEEDAFHLRVDPSLGHLTCAVAGPGVQSMLAGTTRGFVLLWDLRFQIPLQIWQHSSRSAIRTITPYQGKSLLPFQGRNRLGGSGGASSGGGASSSALTHPMKGPVFVVTTEGTNTISAFDTYNGECRTVLRVVNNTSDGGHTLLLDKASQQGKRVSKVAGAGSAARRNLAGGLTVRNLPTLVNHLDKAGTVQPLGNVSRELSRGVGAIDRQLMSVNSVLCCRHRFVMSAGSDRVIRYWDMRDPVASYRISSDDSRPYDLTYSASVERSTVVFRETMAPPPGGVSEFATKSYRDAQAQHMARRGLVAPPPGHRDAILDMKAIEFPARMLVSSSRDGEIKLWS